MGVDDGQGSLVCCSAWGHKESDMTEQLNITELICGAASLALTADSHSRSLTVRAVSRQVRSKARGLCCFVSEA